MRFSLGEALGLKSQLAVGWLAAALAMLPAAFALEFQGGGRPEFVYVAAGQAGAVRTVPILFKEHGTLTARAAARGSRLHSPLPPCVSTKKADHQSL